MTLTYFPQDELSRRILHERDGVVAVDKPVGIPSTGLHLGDEDSVQHALITRYGEMTWAVHQLDADTSGVNVFVRRKELVPRWQVRMRHPNGTKIYLVVVHGRLERRELRIDLPIGVVRTTPSKVLGVGGADQKSARSRVTVLDRTAIHSLLQVEIETGRTHQIRIHTTAIGHPPVGEKWYREPRCDLHPRQALHAWELSFADARIPARIASPIPVDLVDLIESIGMRVPVAPSRA